MRLFRALVRDLAASLGYIEVPRDVGSRLMKINGVFSRSKDRNAELIFNMALLVALCAVSAYGLGKSTLRYGYRLDVLLPIALVQALLFTVLGIVWRRFNTKYQIEGGYITALTMGGKERWSEPMAAMEAMAITQRPKVYTRWLQLKWPEKSRHVELFDSLAAVLHL